MVPLTVDFYHRIKVYWLRKTLHRNLIGKRPMRKHYLGDTKEIIKIHKTFLSNEGKYRSKMSENLRRKDTRPSV